MKICIFTPHFYPEEFKVNDIAFELAKRNHSVTVITAIPDYPQGKYYDGYSVFKRRREMVNGVKVIRTYIIPRGKGGAILLMLNYLSHLVSTLLFTFFHALSNKYDAVFVHETSPFTIGLPATLLKRMQKIPMYFWALDLWPESVKSAGGLDNKYIMLLLNLMVTGVYNNCDRILIGSKGYARSICEKGDYAQKIEYFPNWAEDVFGLQHIQQPKNTPFDSFSHDDFIILFAGNLGEAQNLDAVLEAAKLTKAFQRIKWVLIGSGRKHAYLQDQIQKNCLESSVFLPGRFPLESMPFFMSKADLLLVTLKDEPIFNLTVPAKLQFYMAAGKPILAMLNGDGADLITEATCGYAVAAGDFDSLAKQAIALSKESRDMLQKMGANGKQYYESHFSKQQRLEQLEKLIGFKA